MKSRDSSVVIIIVAVLIVVFGIFLWLSFRPAQRPSSSANPVVTAPSLLPPQSQPAQPIVVSQLTAAQAVAALPANFPSEAGSTLVSGSQIENALIQQTTINRTTTTAKSLAAELTIYQNYLTQNGWTIGETTSKVALASISAVKGSQHIDIVIDYDTSIKTNVVAVSYTH